MVERLGRVIRPTYIPVGMNKPVELLDDDKPIERIAVVDALNLADSEDTVWAEWYRHLAERAIPPLTQMPRDLWTREVDVEVADLSTSERLATVGLSPPGPGHQSRPAFQQAGECLWKDGWPGLLAPSAQLLWRSSTWRSARSLRLVVVATRWYWIGRGRERHRRRILMRTRPHHQARVPFGTSH